MHTQSVLTARLNRLVASGLLRQTIDLTVKDDLPWWSVDYPKMMTIELQTRLPGRPGHIGRLHQFLDYLLGHDRVWICRRNDLAQYWAEHYPNRDS